MGKIMAAGGGDGCINRLIDTETIRLTGKQNPKGLIIPTASGDSSKYTRGMMGYFERLHGCEMESLSLCNPYGEPKMKSAELESTIRQQIMGSDFLYVLGGDTKFMIEVWKELGVDSVLREAYEQGIVLSGSSSGGMCWFDAGNSDSLKMYNPNAPLIKVVGLGLVQGMFCPHYTDEGRQHDLKDMMRDIGGVALGVDMCCAVEIVDSRYRIISIRIPLKKGSYTFVPSACKTYWDSGGRYHEEPLPDDGQFRPLESLLSI